MCNNSSAELAAAINTAASLMAKGKSVDEIEIMAIMFDMLSDTLFSIARIQRHCEKIQEQQRDS
jgi:hypothetical protein